MKVRLEFVTNSSSTSSAVSMGSALMGIITALGLTSTSCGKPGGGDSGDGGGPSMETEAIDAAMEASEQAAREAAEQMEADARAREQLIDNVLTGEEQKLDAASQKLQSEIDKYRQQWQDAQQGVDPKDPGYADMNKQYEDYIDYLNDQMDRVKARQYEVQVTKAQEQAAAESRNDWVTQQQQDLVQVMEQKSFLEAVAKGYGKDKNYDIANVQERMKQLAEREQELKKTLKENKAEIDYTPKERDAIGPDPEMAKLNQKYKQEKQQLQQQMQDLTAAEKDKKKAALEQKMELLQKDMETQTKRAAFWNVMTKAAEVTQFGADLGVDILSSVTGPYGKTVKTMYTGLKGLAGGLGEGMANGDMSKNIIKGGISGLSDIAKDKIGDKFGKAAQNLYGIGSEAGKSVLDSALDGKTSAEDLVKAGLSGAAKGSLDASLNIIGDGLLPKGADMPEGLDWSDIDLKTFVNSVKSKNPLTVRGLGREAIGNSLQSAGFDQAKNLIKGDDVIFSGWNQEATGQILDKGSSLGAKQYTPTLVKGLEAVGTGAKTGADILDKMMQQSSSPPPYMI